MSAKKYNLPEFPCKKDVWDTLREEARPIVVYGMGNGADKLIRRFQKYGIKVADFFASDGFVRGHTYLGYRVKTFSEIKETYPEFVIVLSFASNRKDVLEMLSEIDKNYDMYVPDMPVADESEYFDKDFYNANYGDISEVYNALSDETSKNIYAAVLNYRISGKMEYLLGGYSEKEEMYSLLNRKSVLNVVDAGAYNGDTAKEAMEFFPKLEKIYAIEPDKKNFKRLVKFAKEFDDKVIPINAAVGGECRNAEFFNSGNRNSSISSTASHEYKSEQVQVITVDSLNVQKADYLKYDVEGNEYEALIGSAKTVRETHPSMLVSLYHRSRDVFFLPKYLMNEYSGYDFYIRRMYSVPAWELNLIMIPKNIEIKGDL